MKLFNFRFFTILFFSCALGIILAVLLYNQVLFDYVITILAGTAILAVLVVLKKKGIKWCVFISFTLIFYLYTVSSLSCLISNKTDYHVDFMEVKIEYVSVDGEYICCSFEKGEGILRLDSKDGEALKEGESVLLNNVTVQAKEVTNKNSFNIYALTQNQDYVIYAQSVHEIIDFKPSLAQSLRIGIKEAGESLPKNVKGVTIALLTGDKYGIDDSLYSGYSKSGISHTLAVSGLHVVFLCSAIEFVLRKVRLRKKIRAFITPFVLFLFCATCSFAPSVIRASVMASLHGLIPVISTKRYDSLSTMSLAGVIILSFSPFDLFSYGFVLSFLAVFGIIAFSNKFKKIFKFLPKTIAEIFATSLSANLATFPVSVLFFGEVSVIGLFVNVLVLPVLALFYGALFGGALICAIFPFLSTVLGLIGIVVEYVNLVAVLFASLPFATIAPSMPVWFLTGYYAGGLLLSDYVFMPKELKRGVLVLFLAMVLVYLLFPIKV